MSTTYVHLPVNYRTEAKKWNFPLGVEGFRFADLNRVRRLAALDEVFVGWLKEEDPVFGERFAAWRKKRGEGYEDTEQSAILIEAAPYVGRFIARLFHIEEAYEGLRRKYRDEAVIYRWKRKFLDREILKAPPSPEELTVARIEEVEFDYREIVEDLFPGDDLAEDPERELAEVTMGVIERLERARKEGDATAAAREARRLALIKGWTRLLAFHPALAERRKIFPTFHRPGRQDFEHLVERVFPDPAFPERCKGPEERRRYRDGFKLTDPRWTPRETTREAHYCILCHERKKDSCNKGLRDREGKVRRNPLGIPLNGCPLDEKISEAHALKREGELIGALAVIMIDNPMLAGTGHRICNDCMKACIYQKQEPVNIPQVETGILTEVLALPYGFEILSLLTRWNPINARRPVPLPYNGKNVLVVGMGPAGYTLAHHLLNEGFGVVGIDGLKIEPLSIQMRGAKRRVPKPLKDIRAAWSSLDERLILGFGGVSEYGITVRWDKNFLDINYMLLMRRKKFRLHDGVRFGGTITIEDAWELGFDHVASAAGAGKPTIIPMKNNLVRGVRKASDFLMALQATGTYKRDALGNLQVELPAIVIGGGLTAIDTATELQAYYIVQVEKTLERYERLVERIGKEAIWERFDEEEARTLRTWLRHGLAVRAERAAARAAGREPNFARLVESWGGVTIVYRKRLRDAPSYRLNHEEIIKCLEEGISFMECMSPVECLADEAGHLTAATFERMRPNEGGRLERTGEIVELPARTLIVAAGTRPNITYEREYPGTFELDEEGYFFQAHKVVKGEDGAFRLTRAEQGDPTAFFTSYEKDGRFITFFGDNHPAYAGNVVKAMASAKRGALEIERLFEERADPKGTRRDQPELEKDWVRFTNRLQHELNAVVVDALRLTNSIVEVIVQAPMAARHFRPGQFFRLQNYSVYAEEVEGFKLCMEGIALTGAWCKPEEGLISLIVLEMGGSSRLCALLEPGEEVVLMGPTGTPTEIPEGETVMLCGGGLGNAVLFSIAAALQEKGNRVIYFGGYKTRRDLFKREEIERGADVVVWSVDRGELIETARPGDFTFRGNIVEAIEAYGSGRLGTPPIPLESVDRIIVIGSDLMMRAVKKARKERLCDKLKAGHLAIGSINSPMQCMMKEICADCLQRHVDPETGKSSFVFSCFNQDQPLDRVDFDHLHQRLRQNSAAEKLTSLWIDYLFAQRMVQKI